MSPKRPGSIMGDDERATIGAGHRAASAIPVEIDPEETQPPQEPPDITALPGFDALDPSIREPMLALHNAQRELDVGLTRLWDTRKVPEQLAELQQTVAVLVDRSRDIRNFQQAVNQHAGVLHRLTQAVESRRDVDARLAAALETLDKRLDDMQRGAAVDKATTDGALEQHKAATTAIADALHTEATERKAGDVVLGQRVQSLEETRSRARGAMWAFGLVAGIVGVIIGLIARSLGKR